jgi:hypothetical protein
MNPIGAWIAWLQAMTVDARLALLQKSMAVAIPLFWVWYYRRLIAGFLRFATRYLGLTAILVLLYLMVYGLIGEGMGIPYLFWHDDFWARALASTGAILLLGVVGVIAYFLDPDPWATERRTSEFLQADERIRHRIQGWYARFLSTPVPPPEDPRWVGRVLRPSDFLTFGMNTLLDPISITPLQSLLEPGQGNAMRIYRLLRSAQGPFMLLLLAPALLPAVFTAVPVDAPTERYGREWLVHLVSSPQPSDAARGAGGYLLGLLAWLLGIQTGVIIIKVFLRIATLPRGFALPARVGANLASVAHNLARTRGLAGVREIYGWRGETRDAQLRAEPESSARPDPKFPGGADDTYSEPGCRWGRLEVRPARAAAGLARNQLRFAALAFALTFLTTYALLGYIRNLREGADLPRHSASGLPLFDLPPAFAICVLLAVLAMGYASVAYLPSRWRLPVVLLIFAWFCLANADPFKYRFENMDYDNPVRLVERVDEIYDAEPPKDFKPPKHPTSDGAALNAWLEENSATGGPDLDAGHRPKLVIVAVSGGAARSAYWTAVVLDRLERTLPSFGRRVRIITGASGGMLGAAYYVSYRQAVARGMAERDGAHEPGPGLKPASLLPTWISKDLPKKSLDPLARGIALAEVWNAAWPWPVLEDRGITLEKDWDLIRYPFVKLAELEGQGKVPSLIFSPMIVEDGRRLLISNLELGLNHEGWAASPIVETASHQIKHLEDSKVGSPDGTGHRRYSLTSLEYFRIFREEAHRNLLLSTAVRMSASFPFVSPAVYLPTSPPRRIVDAGYYDNYGIQVATSWIRRHRAWLAAYTSGVLLVQIRDSSSVRARLGVDLDSTNVLTSPLRGLEFFTSPIDAVLEARNATASFRNDADVAGINSHEWEYGGRKGGKPFEPASFFTTVIFENSAEVTLEPGDFWEELTKLTQKRFHLQLMSWEDGTRVPTSGHALVIVGTDKNNLLHIRVFNSMGDRVTDTDETRLPPAHARAISTLKQQLPELLPPHVLTDAERAQILGEATLLVGQAQQEQPVPGDFREVSMTWYLSHAEMNATASAIPEDPKEPQSRGRDEPDWTNPITRSTMSVMLNGDISYYMKQAVPDLREIRIRMKRLDQLCNYERLINLKRWWERGYDLRLMSWGDGSRVSTSGSNIVIVGTDNNGLLHIRIFDWSGTKVTDTEETKIPASQAGAIAALKQRLPGLLPPHGLTPAEKAELVSEATLIVDQAQRECH